jgi:hypothetical protein
MTLWALGLLGCHQAGSTPPSPSGETGGTPTGSTGSTGSTGTTGSTATTGGTGGGTTTDTGSPPSGFTCSGDPVSFHADVEPIFLGCGGADACHQLTLGKPGGAIPYLVNQPGYECEQVRLLVAPYDPENSFVIDKLTEIGDCSHSPMPKPFAGPWVPLPDDQIQAIYDWICQGALDD